jgi:hypothetical protein
LLSPAMTERMRRHWAASEALGLGRGGVTLLAEQQFPGLYNSRRMWASSVEAVAGMVGRPHLA